MVIGWWVVVVVWGGEVGVVVVVVWGGEVGVVMVVVRWGW